MYMFSLCFVLRSEEGVWKYAFGLSYRSRLPNCARLCLYHGLKENGTLYTFLLIEGDYSSKPIEQHYNI